MSERERERKRDVCNHSVQSLSCCMYDILRDISKWMCKILNKKKNLLSRLCSPTTTVCLGNSSVDVLVYLHVDICTYTDIEYLYYIYMIHICSYTSLE